MYLAPGFRYMAMHKTTIDVNEDLIAQAQAILGTRGIKDTIDASLQDVIARHARRRTIQRLQALDVDPDELRRQVWGV